MFRQILWCSPLLVLFILFSMLRVSDGCSNVLDKIEERKRMKSSSFRIVNNKTLLACISECLVIAKCVSINYKASDNICHLNSESDTTFPDDLHTEEGFIYSSISGWPREFVGACKDLICPDGEICIVDRLHKPRCTYDPNVDCNVPNEMLNAERVTEGLYEGAVATYACKPGYVFCGTSDEQTCSHTGQWLGLDGTCEIATWLNQVQPFQVTLPCLMTPRFKVSVQATPTQRIRMKVTLKTSADVHVMTDMRLNYGGQINTTIFTCKIDETWHPNQTTHFPFTVGVPYHLEIIRTNGEYQVYLNGLYYGGVTDYKPSVHPDTLVISDDLEINNVSFIRL